MFLFGYRLSSTPIPISTSHRLRVRLRLRLRLCGASAADLSSDEHGHHSRTWSNRERRRGEGAKGVAKETAMNGCKYSITRPMSPREEGVHPTLREASFVSPEKLYLGSWPRLGVAARRKPPRLPAWRDYVQVCFSKGGKPCPTRRTATLLIATSEVRRRSSTRASYMEDPFVAAFNSPTHCIHARTCIYKNIVKGSPIT